MGDHRPDAASEQLSQNVAAGVTPGERAPKRLQQQNRGVEVRAAHRPLKGNQRREHRHRRSGVRERSEERRVGKECRSRWWPYGEKKKIKVKSTKRVDNTKQEVLKND